MAGKQKKSKTKKSGKHRARIIIACLVLVAAVASVWAVKHFAGRVDGGSIENVAISEIPEYSGEPYIEIDGNVPGFTDEDMTTEAFEKYSDLDSKGRCGPAYACIGTEIMPTEGRESISDVHPAGYHQEYYDFIEDGILYNRCHLIAFQLAGENANEKNLITGTKYLNVDGMLAFEEQVGNYVRNTGNHVLYRVTPVYEGGNLIASGVQMEAYSVEDKGRAISFNVYCYNVQPGVIIDYKTGYSKADGTYGEAEAQNGSGSGGPAGAAGSGEAVGSTGAGGILQKHYILNTSSKKFHKINCESVAEIAEYNKEDYRGSREDLIARGYEPCGACNP